MSDQYSGPERRSPESAWVEFSKQLASLHCDVGEIKVGMSDFRTGMKEMTKAITKLALVEERQTHASQAIERCFKAAERLQASLDKLDGRVAELERSEPSQNRAAEWVDRAVWAAASASVAMFAAKSGMLG